MCRLLVDAMVWNHLAKARALSGFLASLPTTPVTLAEVVEQLRPALGTWPELGVVMDAVENDEIEDIELEKEEEELRIKLLTLRRGLGVADCGLLTVALRRQWILLACDQAMRKASAKMGIETADLASLLDEAVAKGFLFADDRGWVVAYSQGHAGRRDS